MSAETTDTTEMIAVHDAFRTEFGALPALVAAVPDGGTDRAAVVGGHVMMMTAMLHGTTAARTSCCGRCSRSGRPHRRSSSAPWRTSTIASGQLIDAAQSKAVAWMASASATPAASLALDPRGAGTR